MRYDATLTISGDHCTIHGYHWPPINRTVKHHIIPQEWDGPTTPENLLLVCDNGHYNIHLYLEALLSDQTPPKVTRKEKHYALVAFNHITGEGAK